MRARARLTLAKLCLAIVVATAISAAAHAQIAGDANCDGVLNDADRVALVDELFVPGAPVCSTADANRDGVLSVADVMGIALGPRITVVGITSADGRPASPLGFLLDGTPVFFNNSGFGFNVVVEATSGPNGVLVGTSVFDSVAGDPVRRPDLQPLIDRPLGNGSPTVCDESGVPATTPADFSLTQPIADALNDLSCRFLVATAPNGTCTQNAFGQADFLSPESRVQFCLPVNGFVTFQTGDTELTVQVRDRTGKIGPMARMIMRVGSGAFPPTFTPPLPTATRTVTRTPTRTPTPSATLTTTATRTRTLSPTRTHTGAIIGTPTVPVTGPPGTTRPTSSRTITRTPTRTATATRTPTWTVTLPPTTTPTSSGTPTPSTTPTPDQPAGPEIVFFGMIRADDVLIEPVGFAEGVPIYQPLVGFGFSLVVEAKSGLSLRPVGISTFSEFGPPDLQIQVTKPIGDGSEAVCDDMPPFLGGVPSIDPPSFVDDPVVTDRLNDFGCRFVDGEGERQGRVCNSANACILRDDGSFGCASPDARTQFCGFVGRTLEFPVGETLVTARILDSAGSAGPEAQIIVRVEPE